MKKTEEKFTKEYNAVVFTADDGTQFFARAKDFSYWPDGETISKAERECYEYEQTCKHAINLQFKKISKEITGKMKTVVDGFINGGNENADYYYVKPSSSDDIEAILKFAKAIGEISLTTVSKPYYTHSYADELETGKGYIVAYWPESPWISLYSLDKLINLLTTVSTSLDNGEEAEIFAPDKKN